MNRRDLLITAALSVGGLSISRLAAAEAYPSGGITITVGFAAGGAGDLAARVAADHARASQKVAVGLDFRPGAGGTLAADQLARARADGATLSLYSASPILVAPHLQKVPYDPLKDFTYIASYVAIAIHAQKANRRGDVLIEGIIGIQKEAVLAARRAVVTVEEVVEDFAGVHPNACVLPHWTVKAIAVVPGGAHPSYAHGYYARDNRSYLEWDAIAADREAFTAWMKQNVLDKDADVFAGRVAALRAAR